MDNAQILAHIDLTLLTPTATEADVIAKAREAIEGGCASLCIHPIFLEAVGTYLEQEDAKLTLCTVIGFPLGTQTLQIKWREAREALHLGAREIDAVVNPALVKAGDWDGVRAELQGLREATQGYILKVIIETCQLIDSEKIALCELITECQIDYIKTSTGFGAAGAELKDIALFKEHLGPDVKIKAAGGIRTREAMVAFLEAGCDRIGASKAMEALSETEPSDGSTY